MYGGRQPAGYLGTKRGRVECGTTRDSAGFALGTFTCKSNIPTSGPGGVLAACVVGSAE